MNKQATIELKPTQIHDDKLIRSIAARACRIPEKEIRSIDYLKRSLDCRNKTPRYLLLVEVSTDENIENKSSIKSQYKDVDSNKRVIIIGAGPAGYFAALELLELGLKPVIFERGKDVRERRRDLKPIMQQGIVNPNSNYCFGEGGAGAYSDGKLYTRSDKRGNLGKVLQILVEHGADQDIMIDAHPHVGSDKLPKIIASIRETILKHGGEINFNSQVTDIIFNQNLAVGVIINNTDEFYGDSIILATGHSARDIYYLFDKKKIFIESKSYAVGIRVEHYQKLINKIQYGKEYSELLPPASYKLTAQADGRGVFSFCMCPGGLIVPSVTVPNELVINGMSMSGRNSRFANSGIVTSVSEKDFSRYQEFGALSGLKYQENLEKRFYTGDSENFLKAPAQRLLDFIDNKKSDSLNDSSYIPGLIISDLNKLFPKTIASALRNGMRLFGTKMMGYLTHESNIIGLESRTSSPVRITRSKELLSHVEIKNLFPCGEGSGYAGGIVSSAIDGQNAARAVEKIIF